jgi:hypothetical protein
LKQLKTQALRPCGKLLNKTEEKFTHKRRSKMKIETLLQAISLGKYNSVLRITIRLGDHKPNSRDSWRDFYDMLRQADNDGLVTLHRNFMGDIEAATLTEAGIERLKQSLIVDECSAVSSNNDVQARETAQERYTSILDAKNAKKILEGL